jgi:signal transduction histidine kinase
MALSHSSSQTTTVCRSTQRIRTRVTASLIVLGLATMLAYSLDRTGWLLSLYEHNFPDTPAAWLGIPPHWLGFAAAIVVELGAVALVATESLIIGDPVLRRWASAGLVIVVAVQGMANLLAGYIRGFWAPQALLTGQPVGTAAWWGAFVVALLAWLIANAAAPALIFILSKALARVLPAAFSQQSRERPRELRALVRRLVRALRDTRAAAEIQTRILADTSRQLANAIAELAQARESLAQHQQLLTEVRAEAAWLHEQHRRATDDLELVRQQHAQPIVGRSQLLTYVRAQLTTGRSLSEIGRELEFTESTLRGWLAKMPVEATNGCIDEEA